MPPHHGGDDGDDGETGDATRNVSLFRNPGDVILRRMARQSRPSPIGDALAWAARIIAIGLAMFLPAVVGGWIDAWAGTAWCGLAGLVVGFVAGLTWLTHLRKPGGRQ